MIISVIYLDLSLLRKLEKEYEDNLEEISNNPQHIYHYILDGFTYEDFPQEFSNQLANLTGSYDNFASNRDFYHEIGYKNYRAVSYYYKRSDQNEGLLILIDRISNDAQIYELKSLFPILKRGCKYLVFTDDQTTFLDQLVKRIIPTYLAYIGILNSFDFEGISSILLLQGVESEYKG